MTNTLGSYPNELLLSKLQPSYWFSAHLHVHYAAIVDHDMLKKGIYPPSTRAILNGRNLRPLSNLANETVVNPDEIAIDLDDNPDETPVNLVGNPDKIAMDPSVCANKPPPTVADPDEIAPTKCTKFLSLDKCLPRRQFLQIIDIPSANDATEDYDFYYDLEWLSITRAMHPYLSTAHQQSPLPSNDDLKVAIKKEHAYLTAKLESRSLDLKIPHNFEPTAPAYNPAMPNQRQYSIDYRKYL
jgi:lariat debranching enzyme